MSTNKRNIIFSKQNNTSLLKHDYIPVIEKALYSKFKEKKESTLLPSSFHYPIISPFVKQFFRMKVYHQ